MQVLSFLKDIFLWLISAGIKKDKGPYKNITWLFLSGGYGDYFAYNIFPREIKRIFPDCRLTVVSQKRHHIFFRQDKNADFLEIVPESVRIETSLTKPADTVKLMKILKKHKTELLICCPAFLRTHLLPFIRLSGVRKIICHGIPERSTDFILFREMYNPERKTREMLHDLLLSIGNSIPDMSTSYHIEKKHITKAQRLINTLNRKKKPFILFNPEGSHKQHRLDDTQITGSVKELRRILPEYFILVICYERNVIQLEKEASTDYFENMQFSGTDGTAMIQIDDIELVAALIQQAPGVLSVDTSTVHMADAFDRPLAALYSANTIKGNIIPPVQVWRSYRPETVNIYSKKITAIKPGQIAQAMKSALENSAKKQR